MSNSRGVLPEDIITRMRAIDRKHGSQSLYETVGDLLVLEQEAQKREEGWREHVIDLHDQVLTLEQEVERLRLQIERHESAIASYRADRDTAERKLERVRSALRMAGRLAIDERWDQRFPKVFGEMEAALDESGEGR